MSEYRCFFADRDAGPCSGALVKAHLLPRRLLRTTYKHGAVLDTDGWRPLARGEDRYDLQYRSLRDLIDDSRIIVPCCGGIVGNGAHHGMLDVSRTLRIPRADLPEGVEEFAEEMGLVWYLDRTYGPLTPPAALDQIGRAA